MSDENQETNCGCSGGDEEAEDAENYVPELQIKTPGPGPLVNIAQVPNTSSGLPTTKIRLKGIPTVGKSDGSMQQTTKITIFGAGRRPSPENMRKYEAQGIESPTPRRPCRSDPLANILRNPGNPDAHPQRVPAAARPPDGTVTYSQAVEKETVDPVDASNKKVRVERQIITSPNGRVLAEALMGACVVRDQRLQLQQLYQQQSASLRIEGSGKPCSRYQEASARFQAARGGAYEPCSSSQGAGQTSQQPCSRYQDSSRQQEVGQRSPQPCLQFQGSSSRFQEARAGADEPCPSSQGAGQTSQQPCSRYQDSSRQQEVGQRSQQPCLQFQGSSSRFQEARAGADEPCPSSQEPGQTSQQPCSRFQDSSRQQEVGQRSQQPCLQFQGSGSRFQETSPRQLDASQRYQQPCSQFQGSSPRFQETSPRQQESSQRSQQPCSQFQASSPRFQEASPRQQEPYSRFQEASQYSQQPCSQFQEVGLRQQDASQRFQEPGSRFQETSPRQQESSQRSQQPCSQFQEGSPRQQEDSQRLQQPYSRFQETSPRQQETSQRSPQPCSRLQETTSRQQEAEYNSAQATLSSLQGPCSKLQPPQSRLQAPQSRLQAPQSRLQAPQSRLQAPQSRLQDSQIRQAPQSRLQAPQSRLQAPQSRLQDSQIRQAPQSRLQAPQSRLQAPQSRLEGPQTRQAPPSRLQAPQSRLQPPQSRLQPPQSRLQPPQTRQISQSRIQAPQSRIQAPRSKLVDPRSRLQPPQSRLQGPCSNIQKSRLQQPSSSLQNTRLQEPQTTRTRLPSSRQQPCSSLPTSKSRLQEPRTRRTQIPQSSCSSGSQTPCRLSPKSHPSEKSIKVPTPLPSDKTITPPADVDFLNTSYIPKSPVDATLEEIKQLLEEEKRDVLQSQTLSPELATKLKQLKKKTLLEETLQETISTLNVDVIETEDSCPSGGSDVLASLMHSEERGVINTVSSPKRMYDALFGASGALEATLEDERSVAVSPAAPSPLNDIVVPVGEASQDEVAVLMPEIEYQVAQTDQEIPKADAYSESLQQQGSQVPQVTQVCPSKRECIQRNYPELAYIPRGELEEEKAPWDIDLGSLEDLVGGQLSMMSAGERLPSDESIRATLQRFEYILDVEKPKNYSCVQLRGTQRPPWFPGYFFVHPENTSTSPSQMDNESYVRLEHDPSKVFAQVWQIFKPNNLRANSEIVIL